MAFSRTKSIRLTRARTADNPDINPITGEPMDSSAPLMRTTFSDLKNRDARQALRQQFSSAFIDNAEPIHEEPTSPAQLAARTDTISSKLAVHPETSLRGNLLRSRTAPALTVTPMPTIVEPDRLAAAAEGPSQLDVEQAINLLEQLKKTASPDQLVALHRALLPTKDVITPVTPMFPADALSLPGPAPPQRMSALGVPGLATRHEENEDVLRKPTSSNFLLKPVPATARRRNRRGDGDANSPRGRSNGGLYSPDFHRLPTMHEVSRSDTPELVSPAPGAFQYGSLRITNGETPASPEPSRPRKLSSQLSQPPLAQPPHSPASVDSAMTPETPVDPYTPGYSTRSRQASQDEEGNLNENENQEMQEERRYMEARSRQLSHGEKQDWPGEHRRGASSSQSQYQSPSNSIPASIPAERSVSPPPQRFPRSRLDHSSDQRDDSDSAPVSPIHPHEIYMQHDRAEDRTAKERPPRLSLRQSLQNEPPLHESIANNTLLSEIDRPMHSASYLSNSRGPATPLTPMSISTVGSMESAQYEQAEIVHRDARTVALSRLTGAMVIRPSMMLQHAAMIPGSPTLSDASTNEPKTLLSSATEEARDSMTRQAAPSVSDSGYSSYEMAFPTRRRSSEGAPKSPGDYGSSDNLTPTLPRMTPVDLTTSVPTIGPASTSTTQHKYRSSLADDQRKSFKDFLTAPPGASTPPLAQPPLSSLSSQASLSALNDSLSVTSDDTQESGSSERTSQRKLQKPMPLAVLRRQQEERETVDKNAREATALQQPPPPPAAVASLNRHSRVFEQKLQDSSRVVINGSEMSFTPVAPPAATKEHSIAIPAEPPHEESYSGHAKSMSSSTTATAATTASSKTARGTNGKSSRGRSDASSKTTVTTAASNRDQSPFEASDSAGDRKGSSWSFARLRSKSRARQAADAEARKADAAAAAASFPSLPVLNKQDGAEGLPRPEFFLRDRTDSQGSHNSGKSGVSTGSRLPWGRKDANATPTKVSAAPTSSFAEQSQSSAQPSQSAVRPRTAGSQYPPTSRLLLASDAGRPTGSFDDQSSKQRPAQWPQEPLRIPSNPSASEILDRTLHVGATRNIAPPLPSPLFPPADPRLRSTANPGMNSFDRAMWPPTSGAQPYASRNNASEAARPKTSHAEDASSSRYRGEGGRPRGPSSPSPVPPLVLEDLPIVSAKVLEAKRLLQQRREEEEKQARALASSVDRPSSPAAGLGIGFDPLSTRLVAAGGPGLSATSPIIAAMRSSMDDRRDNGSSPDNGRIEAPIEFASMSPDGSDVSAGRVRGKGGWEAQVKLMRKKNLEALGVGVDGDSEQSSPVAGNGAPLRRADTASSTGTTTSTIPRSAAAPALPQTKTAAAEAKTQNMMMMMNLSDESHRRQRENLPAPLPAPSPAPTREPTLPNVSPLPQIEPLAYPPAFQHRPTTSSTSASTPADELSEISAQFPQPPPTNLNRTATQQAYLAQSNGGGLRGHPVQPLPLDFPQRQVPTASQQKQQMHQQNRQHKYSFDARFDEERTPHASKGSLTSATVISVQGQQYQQQQQQQRGQPVRADSAQSSTSSTTTSSALSNQSGTTSRTTMNSSAGTAGANSNGYNHYHNNSNATTGSNSNYASHHTHTSSNRSFGNNNSNNYVPPPSLSQPIPPSPRTFTAQTNSGSYQADRFRAKVAAKTSAAALMIRSAHHPAPTPPPAFAAPSPPGGPHARTKVPLLAEQLARTGLPPVVTTMSTNFNNVPSAANPGSSSISPLANSPLRATMERERQQQQPQPQLPPLRFRQQQNASPDDIAPSSGPSGGPTTTASMASAATAALAMDHRFSGGFQYGWDRERGFTGSAGTNSGEVEGMRQQQQQHGKQGSRDGNGEMNRRSVVMSDGFGVDLTDVPVFLRRVER